MKIHNATGDLSSEVESQKTEESVGPKEWKILSYDKLHTVVTGEEENTRYVGYR